MVGSYGSSCTVRQDLEVEGVHHDAQCCLPVLRMDRLRLKRKKEKRLDGVFWGFSPPREHKTSLGNLELASKSATGWGFMSQQTVVTEGLCGKTVKFGLKQAVSLVMSCVRKCVGPLKTAAAFPGPGFGGGGWRMQEGKAR